MSIKTSSSNQKRFRSSTKQNPERAQGCVGAWASAYVWVSMNEPLNFSQNLHFLHFFFLDMQPSLSFQSTGVFVAGGFLEGRSW